MVGWEGLFRAIGSFHYCCVAWPSLLNSRTQFLISKVRWLSQISSAVPSGLGGTSLQSQPDCVAVWFVHWLQQFWEGLHFGPCVKPGVGS